MGRYKAHEDYIVFGKPTVFNGRINIAHPDIDLAKDLTLSTYDNCACEYADSIDEKESVDGSN